MTRVAFAARLGPCTFLGLKRAACGPYNFRPGCKTAAGALRGAHWPVSGVPTLAGQLKVQEASSNAARAGAGRHMIKRGRAAADLGRAAAVLRAARQSRAGAGRHVMRRERALCLAAAGCESAAAAAGSAAERAC